MDNLTTSNTIEENAIKIQHKIEIAQDSLFEMLTDPIEIRKYWYFSKLIILSRDIDELAAKIVDLSHAEDARHSARSR